MMDVRSFKLQTGQELVAELVRETGTGYIVKNPLVLHAMNTPQGPSLGFAPWSLIAETGIDIELLDGALCARPIPIIGDIASSYAEQVTGLVLPPSATGQFLRG